MKDAEWKKLTIGLIEKYNDLFRTLMAAYDVLRDYGIASDAVTEKASGEPFLTMTHPAIDRLG
jgi:hypothetical protein